MSPNPLCLAWREQIMDNLRLISGRSAFIDIYTARHPNKSYTIYAVKVHKGKRQEILSAAGRDLEDAYETLHTKSAQEVYQFVELNGFAFPRGMKRNDSDSSDSEASTLDASDVLSLSAVSSDSENDDAAVCNRGKKTKSSHRRGKKKSGKNMSSSETDSDSEADITRRRHTGPVPRPSYIPAPPITSSQPPPPPPGWRGPPGRMYPRAPGQGPPPPLPPPGRFPPGMRPPHSTAPPQPAPAPVSVSAAPPPVAPPKPVRLVINWAGHGEKKIVELCQPSHRALQRTALAHVRSHWQSFENVLPQEMTPGRLWGLGAKVRRVAFGKDMYTISAAGGDDLTMYFKSDDIPKFEIEVEHETSVAPPPPPPPPAHTHSQH